MSEGYIELCDENGKYRITREDPPVTLGDFIELMVIPLLLAAGYNRKSIDEYYIQEPE